MARTARKTMVMPMSGEKRSPGKERELGEALHKFCGPSKNKHSGLGIRIQCDAGDSTAACEAVVIVIVFPEQRWREMSWHVAKSVICAERTSGGAGHGEAKEKVEVLVMVMEQVERYDSPFVDQSTSFAREYLKEIIWYRASFQYCIEEVDSIDRKSLLSNIHDDSLDRQPRQTERTLTWNG